MIIQALQYWLRDNLVTRMKKRQIILSVLLFTWFYGVTQDSKSIENYKDESYTIINKVLKSSKKVYLKKRFQSLKTINKYFTDIETLDQLMGNCIGNDQILEINQILTNEEALLIKKMTEKAKRRKIEWRYLDKHIVFCNCKKEDACKSEDIKSVTMPVILNNKAIISIQSENEGSIYILEKLEDDWVIKCNKRMYLTIVDNVIDR